MSQLIGIARIAAQSPLLEAKRRVSYFELQGKSLVNRCSGKRRFFDWTVNPYRGCEYGCRYCYARYTHEFMELPGEDFETRIYAKAWDPVLWRRDLRKIRTGDTVAFGTATDCYQPAERRYGLMRHMLEGIQGVRGLRIGFTTKSDLIPRDIDLLCALSRHNDVRVYFTITSLNAELARQTEPFAPRPELRLAAMEMLSSAGVSVGLSASPVLPLITDAEESLDALARAAKAAGARTMYANPLFLRPSAYAIFLPWIRANFPHLTRRYEEQYAHQSYLEGPYKDQLAARVNRIRERHGLDCRVGEPLRLYPIQLSLFK